MTGKILKNVVIGILGLVAVSLMTKGGFYMVVGFLLIALLLFKNYLDGKTKKEMEKLNETEISSPEINHITTLDNKDNFENLIIKIDSFKNTMFLKGKNKDGKKKHITVFRIFDKK